MHTQYWSLWCQWRSFLHWNWDTRGGMHQSCQQLLFCHFWIPLTSFVIARRRSMVLPADIDSEAVYLQTRRRCTLWRSFRKHCESPNFPAEMCIRSCYKKNMISSSLHYINALLFSTTKRTSSAPHTVDSKKYTTKQLFWKCLSNASIDSTCSLRVVQNDGTYSRTNKSQLGVG